MGYAFLDLDGDYEKAVSDLNGSTLPNHHKRLFVTLSKYNEEEKNKAKKEQELVRSMKTPPSKNLFVTGFNPQNASNYSLKQMFSNYGNVVNCNIVKSYAFISYDTVQAARFFYLLLKLIFFYLEIAKESLNNVVNNNLELKVEYQARFIIFFYFFFFL
jgi:hypothetical protein